MPDLSLGISKKLKHPINREERRTEHAAPLDWVFWDFIVMQVPYKNNL
jgi:hypothetical protein